MLNSIRNEIQSVACGWHGASDLWTVPYIMCEARYFYLCLFYKHIWIRVTCEGEFEFGTDGQIFLCIFILTNFFSLLSCVLFFLPSLARSVVFPHSQMDGTVVSLWMLGCCAAAAAEYWMLLLFMYSYIYVMLVVCTIFSFFVVVVVVVGGVRRSFCESISFSVWTAECACIRNM